MSYSITAYEEKYSVQGSPFDNSSTRKHAPERSEPVHPSWQASQNKKRQYASVKQYQGSKIKFNSDSEVEDQQMGESEVLHPSWEASKLKKKHSTIQVFQGKKMKFDSDSD